MECQRTVSNRKYIISVRELIGEGIVHSNKTVWDEVREQRDRNGTDTLPVANESSCGDTYWGAWGSDKRKRQKRFKDKRQVITLPPSYCWAPSSINTPLDKTGLRRHSASKDMGCLFNGKCLNQTVVETTERPTVSTMTLGNRRKEGLQTLQSKIIALLGLPGCTFACTSGSSRRLANIHTSGTGPYAKLVLSFRNNIIKIDHL